MWASGFVNDYAMRLIDDNPTSWRPLSPGGQLIDPGYINPQNTEVTIHFNTKPKNAVDILSKETISIKQNMKLSVPAGSMRFIDFEFSKDDI